MNHSQQRRSGFTLIEIIVVIVVIGILASITTFGFSRFQADSRDAQREAAASIIVERLEKYFDENGEYPSCAAISGSPTDAVNTLGSIDPNVLVAPAAPSNEQNSIKCTTTLTVGGQDFFEYRGDGSANCTSGTSCLAYTLRYISEANGEIVEVPSRRTTPITSTGTITNLTATATGFYSVNLSWGAILEASGYRVQRATNNTFTTGLVTTDVDDPTATISGLTQNTTYYFRVTQIVAGTPGTWSNTASATTFDLATPTISSANVASATSVTVNWNNVANEASYTLRYSTSSTFASGINTISGIAANSTSRTVTGLTTGTTYYFQVRAENGSLVTAWSNTANATPIGQGSITSATVSACGQVTLSWTALAGASTYTINHSASSSMTSPTTITGATGTSRAIAGLPQGAVRYFTVAGVTASGYTGQASTVASATPSVCPPPAYSVSQSNGSSLTATANVTCAAGTVGYYSWTANGSAWVAGTQYRSVSYALGYGQGVTLAVTSRCQNGSNVSGFVPGNNSVSYTRPGMGLSIGFGDDACSGSFCGRRVNASWNNVCGTGSSTIYATQYSYNTTMSGTATSHTVRWKGASSPGAPTSYNVNIGCTSSSTSFNVVSIYKCTGCS